MVASLPTLAFCVLLLVHATQCMAGSYLTEKSTHPSYRSACSIHTFYARTFRRVRRRVRATGEVENVFGWEVRWAESMSRLANEHRYLSPHSGERHQIESQLHAAWRAQFRMVARFHEYASNKRFAAQPLLYWAV